MAAQPALEAVEAIASVWEYHDPRNPPATLVLFKDTLGNRQVLFKSNHTGMLSDVHGAWFIVRDTTTQQVFLKLEFNCRGSKAKSLVNLAFQQVTHLIFEAKRSGVWQERRGSVPTESRERSGSVASRVYSTNR